MIRTWWNKQSGRNKTLALILAAMCVLMSSAALYGWLAPEPAQHTSKPRPSQSVDQPSDTATQESMEEAEADTIDSSEYRFDVDENGMVVMPVTTDPREAAAGAAAVAFSVEFSKLSRQQFLDVAIERMTHPSDQYRGPGDEISTLVKSAPFEETEFFTTPPAEVLHEQVDRWAQYTNPERYTWWTLANGYVYDNFSLLPDHSWKAHPTQVVNETEMAELDASVLPKFPAGTDITPDTPGATLTQWWVLSDVENSQVGTASASPLHSAHFAIWCDAPDDGGLCAVAYTLDSSFPASWPQQ